jgi:hypothetical protein
MSYLDNRRPSLGAIERTEQGIFWIPSHKASALGIVQVRIGSRCDSPSDEAIIRAASALNKEAQQRLRASRARRRLSTEARQAIKQSAALPG